MRMKEKREKEKNTKVIGIKAASTRSKEEK